MWSDLLSRHHGSIDALFPISRFASSVVSNPKDHVKDMVKGSYIDEMLIVHDKKDLTFKNKGVDVSIGLHHIMIELGTNELSFEFDTFGGELQIAVKKGCELMNNGSLVEILIMFAEKDIMANVDFSSKIGVTGEILYSFKDDYLNFSINTKEREGDTTFMFNSGFREINVLMRNSLQLSGIPSFIVKKDRDKYRCIRQVVSKRYTASIPNSNLEIEDRLQPVLQYEEVSIPDDPAISFALSLILDASPSENCLIHVSHYGYNVSVFRDSNSHSRRSYGNKNSNYRSDYYTDGVLNQKFIDLLSSIGDPSRVFDDLVEYMTSFYAVRSSMFMKTPDTFYNLSYKKNKFMDIVSIILYSIFESNGERKDIFSFVFSEISANKNLGQFHTPDEVSVLLSRMLNVVNRGGRGLEPSCGTGALVSGFVNDLDEAICVDIDVFSVNIAAINVFLWGGSHFKLYAYDYLNGPRDNSPLFIVNQFAGNDKSQFYGIYKGVFSDDCAIDILDTSEDLPVERIESADIDGLYMLITERYALPVMEDVLESCYSDGVIDHDKLYMLTDGTRRIPISTYENEFKQKAKNSTPVSCLYG